ncbi:hypothetical protein [Thermosipho sp. (in: thermotogales)]|jgi:hypothetical protein|uniref:hypothetical protein n=1 Tax=Thermosipho sp. (in: thermotogales) TaxID=1968895 RepID=UPI00257C611F|nr:hypothetical protein [Thermosipho sp. (in: thermotogales)]MBZ4649225.1 hypothetical protein [Thermosipho sp. (in: thermotogales)]
MREVTKVYKIYKFDELEPKAKEKAIDEVRNMKYDFIDETLSNVLREELEKYGYPTNDLRYSLNNQQGDGVAFYGNLYEENILKILERLKLEELYKKYKLFQVFNVTRFFTFDIEKNRDFYRYDHFNTMIVRLRIHYSIIYDGNNIYKRITNIFEQIQNVIQDDVKYVSKKLESLGYKIIDDELSDERIIQDIKDNDYEFYSNGLIYKE